MYFYLNEFILIIHYTSIYWRKAHIQFSKYFVVVAKEVQNLAKSSDHSADTIGDTLKEIGNNVGELLNRVKDNNNVQQEQAKKIQSISHSIIAIEENLEDMVSNMQI